MKVVRGDLIELAKNGSFDVIVHGCNCQRVFGAGVARAIREAFPEAYAEDLKTPLGPGKLGGYSFAVIPLSNGAVTVVNAYTQNSVGFGLQVDYSALARVFSKINEDFDGLRIGYPKIGSGLGGGDWEIIRDIIDRELRFQDHTLVEFSR